MKQPFVLRDRYEIQKEISQQPGRQTLLAKDEHYQDLVVIKTVQFGNGFQWADLKLFEREAKILSGLDHPAIPKYRDYFETEIAGVHSFVLVQSYINAISLEETLKLGRTFSKEEVLELAERLLAILSYLHEQSPTIIHRDIKPSNILITNRSGNSIGDIYLIDFGSVHTLASQQSGTITIVGSYGYIPLEQFTGQAVPASDLYSLGMMIIYLMTGVHPAELPQRYGKIQLDPAKFDAKLARWLEKMTEPYADQRFESAKTAMAALQSQDSSYSYYQHLKPAGSRVAIQRNTSCLTITLPVYSCGWVFAAFLSILVFTSPFSFSLLFAISNIWIASIVLGGLMVWMIANIAREADPHRRHVIEIERCAEIREGIYRADSNQVSWNLKKRENFEDISLLAYSPGYTFDRYKKEGIEVKASNAVVVAPKLTVCAGSTEYVVAHPKVTQADFWWIGKELSDFVGLELQTIYATPNIPAESTCGGC